MKVGTDGVLLGAWCRIAPSRDKAILDIGTGTGVIALQLAQRTESLGAIIDAVEIDTATCEQARRNFTVSPWSNRLNAYNIAIQDLVARLEDVDGIACSSDVASRRQYDHIVSNPPYFVDSLTSPNTSRTIARHAISLSYDDLIKCCFMLMKPAGRISLIIPAGAETEKIIETAGKYGLGVSRRTDVYSTPKSGPKRTLIEFSRRIIAAGDTLPISSIPIPHSSKTTKHSTEASQDLYSSEPATLVIEDGGSGTFSDEYRRLTRDFYLYF